jgi:hypothetical protein
VLATLVVSPWRRRLSAALVAMGVAGAIYLWWIDPRQTHLFRCALYDLTGWYCAGCGATRATHELLHGHLLAALSYNALWVLALPPTLWLTACSLRRFVQGGPLPACLTSPWFYLIVIAIGLAFALLRNLPWYPFVLLAPPQCSLPADYWR